MGGPSHCLRLASHPNLKKSSNTSILAPYENDSWETPDRLLCSASTVSVLAPDPRGPFRLLRPVRR